MSQNKQSRKLVKKAIELEEWKDFSRISIREGNETIILSNTAREKIEQIKLQKRLKRIEGIGLIKHLEISANSMINNLDFVSLFPNLSSLAVYGQKINSFDGIEYFKGKRLIIDTGRNKKREIDKINETNISQLIIKWAKEEDIDVISNNRLIKELDLLNCHDLMLDKLFKLPLLNLSLKQFRGEKIEGFSGFENLRRLYIGGCSYLKNLSGYNASVEKLIISSCRYFDASKIRIFQNSNFIDLVDIPKEISLSYFADMPNLKKISINQCKVNIDKKNIKEVAINLESIWIYGIKKEQVIELSKNNENVIISNGKFTIINGILC